MAPADGFWVVVADSGQTDLALHPLGAFRDGAHAAIASGNHEELYLFLACQY